MPNPNQNIPCNRPCRTGTCPFSGSSNGYCCNRCPEHHGRRHTKNCTRWSIIPSAESARSTTRRFHDERETSRFRSRSRPRRYIECMTAGCRFGVHISRRTGREHSCCCKPCKNSRGIDHAWFCRRMLPESLPPQIQRHGRATELAESATLMVEDERPPEEDWLTAFEEEPPPEEEPVRARSRSRYRRGNFVPFTGAHYRLGDEC